MYEYFLDGTSKRDIIALASDFAGKDKQAYAVVLLDTGKYRLCPLCFAPFAGGILETILRPVA